MTLKNKPRLKKKNRSILVDTGFETEDIIKEIAKSNTIEISNEISLGDNNITNSPEDFIIAEMNKNKGLKMKVFTFQGIEIECILDKKDRLMEIKRIKIPQNVLQYLLKYKKDISWDVEEFYK